MYAHTCTHKHTHIHAHTHTHTHTYTQTHVRTHTHTQTHTHTHTCTHTHTHTHIHTNCGLSLFVLALLLLLHFFGPNVINTQFVFISLNIHSVVTTTTTYQISYTFYIHKLFKSCEWAPGGAGTSGHKRTTDIQRHHASGQQSTDQHPG